MSSVLQKQTRNSNIVFFLISCVILMHPLLFHKLWKLFWSISRHVTCFSQLLCLVNINKGLKLSTEQPWLQCLELLRVLYVPVWAWAKALQCMQDSRVKRQTAIANVFNLFHPGPFLEFCVTVCQVLAWLESLTCAKYFTGTSCLIQYTYCIISKYVVLEALIFWHNSNLTVWRSSSLFLTASEEKLQSCRYLFLFVIGSLIVCLTRCLWNFRTMELIKGKKYEKNHNCNLTIWRT